MSKSQDLKEQRASLIAQTRQLFDKVTQEEKRETFTDEEQKEYDTRMADIDHLAEEIAINERKEKLEHVEAEQKQSAGRQTSPIASRSTNVQMSPEEHSEAFRTWCLTGTPYQRSDSDSVYRAANAGFDCQNSTLELRTGNLNVGTNSVGGYTVPINLVTEIQRTLKYYFPIADVVTTQDTAGGEELDFTLDDDTANTSYQVAEEGSIGAADDVVLSRVTMRAYKFTPKILKVSWELLQDSSTNVEQYIGDVFGERFGREIETAVIGTNAGSSAPEGLFYGVSAGATLATGNPFDATFVAKLINLETSLDIAYRRQPGVGFLMHDSVWGAIRQVSTSYSLPLIQTDLTNHLAPRLLGYPVYISNAMTSYANKDSVYYTNKPIVYFGDFSKYRWRNAGGVHVIRLNELYVANGQVGFMMWRRGDGRYTHSKTCAKTLNTYV